MPDPRRRAQGAPDGKKIFGKEAGAFCPGAGKERSDFQGPLQGYIPFFLHKPGSLDHLLQPGFNLAFLPGGKKGQTKPLTHLG
jgi:hypothetical protein